MHASIHQGSRIDFDLVVFELDHGRTTHDFEKDGNPFAGDALDQAFNTSQSGVFEPHGLPGFEVTQLLQGGVVAVLFELANALHQGVVQHGRLKTETNDGRNAFGAAYRRNALFWFAGPEQHVARKHGLKQSDRALFGFFELFVARQISLEGLLLQVDQGDLLLPGFGVGQVPAV